MVHRDIEEALDLVCVQVHRDDTGHPGSTQQVSHELSSDGDTWLILTILASPPEVRDHCCDVVRRGTLSSIDHQEKLHDIIRRWIGRLDKEDILTTDAVLVVDRELSVCEVLYLHVA